MVDGQDNMEFEYYSIACRKLGLGQMLAENKNV